MKVNGDQVCQEFQSIIFLVELKCMHYFHDAFFKHDSSWSHLHSLRER